MSSSPEQPASQPEGGLVDWPFSDTSLHAAMRREREARFPDAEVGEPLTFGGPIDPEEHFTTPGALEHFGEQLDADKQ